MVAENQPPQAIICSLCSAADPPATLLKDSTNQPERVNLFAVPVSSPDREKAHAVLTKGVAIHDRTRFQLRALNHSFVHPSPDSPSYIDN